MACRSSGNRIRRVCLRWRTRLLAQCVEWERRLTAECVAWGQAQQRRCAEWRERREQQCSDWEARQEQRCDRWETERRKECESWSPLFSWICLLFVWVTTTVCKAWATITTWICRAWTWVVVEVVCAVWTWVTVAVCRLWILIVSFVCRVWTFIVERLCDLWATVVDIACAWWCFFLRSTAGNEVSEQRSECVFGWTAAFRITEDPRACVLHVVLRIRLRPDAGVSAADLAAAQGTWETAIESTWTDAMPLRRTDGDCACEEYRVEVDVQWVDTNEHHTVQVHAGSGRADMGNWFITSTGRTVAHEAGHMFGNPDEYPEPDRCPNRVTFADDSIMAAGGTVHDRHYRRFADWVSAFTCCDYVPEERAEE